MKSSSGRRTFENALAVQYVSRDNHCVEVLGEAWSAWGFEGLACLTPLRNTTRQPVKHWQIDLRPRGYKLISQPFQTDIEPRSLSGYSE